MKFTVNLILLLSSVTAAAGERTVMSDSENYTAIGYSDNASAQLAKQDACDAARRELIGHIFGAAYQINQNMVRSLGVLDYSQDVSANTGEIVIRGAITETESSHGTTKCTIIYPTQEAKLEQERLKATEGQKSIQFTDIGDSTNIKGGVLEVVTVPGDVDVLVDNVRWGTTPLRLNGRLSIGKHLVRLEHEDYKVYEQQIEIGAASKVRVDKILIRATGKLAIKTVPSGATVKINGQDVGTSPTGFLDLPAGQKLKIEITHPETETYSQTLRLNRDEEKTSNIELPLKPAQISVNVVPSTGVSVSIDGQDGSLNRWIKVEPGKHEILAKKSGYVDQQVNIEVRGGDHLALPTINLVKEDVAKKERQRAKEAEQEASRREKEIERAANEKANEEAQLSEQKTHGLPWSLGLYMGGSQSPLSGVDPQLWQLGFQARYQMFRYVSSEFILTYDTGSTTYSNATLNASGYGAIVGFPVRLYQSTENNLLAHWLAWRVSLSPEIAWSTHSYAASYSAGGTSGSVTYSQIGYGAALIYSLSTPTEDKKVGYFVDFRFGGINYQSSSGLQGATPLSVGTTMGVNW